MFVSYFIICRKDQIVSMSYEQLKSLKRIRIKSQLAREVLAEFAGTFILLVRQLFLQICRSKSGSTPEAQIWTIQQ